MKRHLIDSLVSLFAPHECLVCGDEPELLCASCAEGLKVIPPCCPVCGALSEDYAVCSSGCRKSQLCNRIYARTSFDPLQRRLIARSKYERSMAAHKVLAREITLALPGYMPGFVVTHVPTTNMHVRNRGFDHANRIAGFTAEYKSLPAATLLGRTNNQTQVGKKRTDRLKLSAKSFRFVGETVPEKVLLVDDVMTTGATLAAASKVLKKAGVKHVYAAVFARA